MRPRAAPLRPPSTGWMRRRGFWRAGPTRPTVWPTVVARPHPHLRPRTTRRLAVRAHQTDWRHERLHTEDRKQWSGRGQSTCARWKRQREHFTRREVSTLLWPRRSTATWEDGRPHSGSLWFADTEEVTGSNPVAPTTKALTSGNAVDPCASYGRRGEVSTLPFGKSLSEVSWLLPRSSPLPAGLPTAALSFSDTAYRAAVRERLS
jgi:hypothetical protein